MDSFSNFVLGTLSSGINSGATSATLTSGQGSRFSTLTAPYNVTLWDSGNYSSPGAAYWAGKAEVARVTGRSGDVLTISRAQESTSAVNFTGLTVTVFAAVSAKTLKEIELSLPTAGDVDPEGAIDGNKGRPYRNLTTFQDFVKGTDAGTLTGWQ